MHILTHKPLPHAQKKFKFVQGLSTETEWLLDHWQAFGLSPLVPSHPKSEDLSLALTTFEGPEDARFLGGLAILSLKKSKTTSKKIKILRAIFGCTVSVGQLCILPCVHSPSDTQLLQDAVSVVLADEVFAFVATVPLRLSLELVPEVRLGVPRSLQEVRWMALTVLHARAPVLDAKKIELLFGLWSSLGDNRTSVRSLSALLKAPLNWGSLSTLVPPEVFTAIQDLQAQLQSGSLQSHQTQALGFFLEPLFPSVTDWSLQSPVTSSDSVLLVGKASLLKLFLSSQLTTFFKTDAVIVFFRDIGLELTQATASQLLKSFSVPATGGHVTLSYTTKMVGQKRERGWQMSFRADEGLETALSDNFFSKKMKIS